MSGKITADVYIFPHSAIIEFSDGKRRVVDWTGFGIEFEDKEPNYLEMKKIKRVTFWHDRCVCTDLTSNKYTIRVHIMLSEVRE